MAQRFHTLEVAGVRRELPILNVTDELAIAGFIMLGDVVRDALDPKARK